MRQSIRVTLFTITVLLIASGSAFAQNYGYNSGMHALEFQAVSSGDITPTGESVAWTSFQSDKSALRYSLNFYTGLDFRSSDTNQNYGSPASNDNERKGFGGELTVSTQWVYYPMAGERIQLSTAIGPLLGYGWNYSNSRIDYLEVTGNPPGNSYVSNEDVNNRTFSAGLFTTLGCQYFFVPRFALSAWYGLEMTMDIESSSRVTRRNYESENQTDTRTTDDQDRILARLGTSSAGIGLTFYY